MNCRAAKKQIPLFAGGELEASRSDRIRLHLADCPECRAEAEEFERSRQAVRGMAGAAAAGDWTPGEWNRMIRTITATRGESRTREALYRLRPALAGAMGVLLAAGVFLVQRELRQPSAPETGSFAVIHPETQAAVPDPAPTKDPDVKSVTMISPESGLKIHWFYNKKFEWQGFGK
jgi:anti-sigma factor RsiW